MQVYDDKQKSNTKNEEIEQYIKLPIRILKDKNLTDKQKLIFGSIITLAGKTGVCFASNSYLAKIHGCDERTVIRTINKLVKLSYISRKLIHLDSDTKKRVIKRELTINDFGTDSTDRGYCLTSQGGTVSRVQKGTVSDVTDKLYIETININNKYSRADGKNKKLVSEVIDYLNEKAGKSYKATTQRTISLISARNKEGFTIYDFKKVIDTKTQQWKSNADMNKYLRPETLFGTKFESYLQEDPNINNNNRFPDKKNYKPDIENELKKYGR